MTNIFNIHIYQTSVLTISHSSHFVKKNDNFIILLLFRYQYLSVTPVLFSTDLPVILQVNL